MPVHFYEPQEDITIYGATYKRGEILAFKDVPLVTVESNKNRDVISEDDAKNVAASVIMKPISYEHRMNGARGMFTDARYEAPHVITSGIIYTKHSSPQIIDDLKAGLYSLSIEASADKARCSVCNQEFEKSDDYCNHLKARVMFNAYRHFVGMYGTGGGIVRDPAGSNTNIPSEKISIVASHQLVGVEGRDFSEDERKQLAKSGEALPDGSFPIASEQDLQNAIHAVGRASDVEKAKQHIISRAKAMGLSRLLPDDWVKGATMPETTPTAESPHADAETAAEKKKETAADEKKEDAKQSDGMEKMKADMKAALDKAEKLEQENTALRAEVKANIEKYRKYVLVSSGVLNDEEWSTNADSLMASDDKTIELLASKGATKPSMKLAGGGIQNVTNSVPITASKPKLVLG